MVATKEKRNFSHFLKHEIRLHKITTIMVVAAISACLRDIHTSQSSSHQNVHKIPGTYETKNSRPSTPPPRK